MPKTADEMELNQRQNVNYIDDITDAEEQASDMTMPQFEKPAIPVLEIIMGTIGAVWLALTLLM